jgi:hypothetical protein
MAPAKRWHRQCPIRMPSVPHPLRGWHGWHEGDGWDTDSWRRNRLLEGNRKNRGNHVIGALHSSALSRSIFTSDRSRARTGSIDHGAILGLCSPTLASQRPQSSYMRVLRRGLAWSGLYPCWARLNPVGLILMHSVRLEGAFYETGWPMSGDEEGKHNGAMNEYDNTRNHPRDNKS